MKVRKGTNEKGYATRTLWTLGVLVPANRLQCTLFNKRGRPILNNMHLSYYSFIHKKKKEEKYVVEKYQPHSSKKRKKN